jgi:hypothetical protein
MPALLWINLACRERIRREERSQPITPLHPFYDFNIARIITNRNSDLEVRYAGTIFVKQKTGP